MIPRYSVERVGPRSADWPRTTVSPARPSPRQTAPLLPVASPKKRPMSGYAGFVPGYISNNTHGTVWTEMMKKNESYKEQPPANWADVSYITSKNDVEAREKTYMLQLWEKEQQSTYDPSVRFWNLHDLNRCRDPLVKPPTYMGYVPHIGPENLVGGTFGKTLKASHRSGSASPSRDTLRTPRSAVRIPVSNDATGRAPAHFGHCLEEEMPWLLTNRTESYSAAMLLKGLSSLPPQDDPANRSRPSTCSNRQWVAGEGMQTSWSLLDASTRSNSVYETPPSQRSALLPCTFRLRSAPGSTRPKMPLGARGY